MALRRSSRILPRTVQTQAPTATDSTINKKRTKLSAEVKDRNIDEGSKGELQQDATVPTTPVPKKRKLTPLNPPALTPTPSAVGLMIEKGKNGPVKYSSGDVDDVPPQFRPVDPHHTNAALITPRGTELLPTYSNFEESPSKPVRRAETTTQTLLDKACSHLIAVDPKLKPVIDQHYCHVFSPEGLAESIDPFRSLASGIMAQQVSGAAASSIKNKFIALFPDSDRPNGFPTPSIVARTSLTRLREAGLSQRKAEYIQGLAEKFDSGELSVNVLMSASDEQVMEKLVAVRGLGAWSVEMFMCFGLKRMDVFSTGDLGVQRGMAAHAGRDVAKLKAKGGGKWKYMSEKDMLENAEKFRPYRSLFMWYMWRIEDVNVEAMQT